MINKILQEKYLMMNRLKNKTRFAPSPSGYLHLGHIFAAKEAQRVATGAGGECLLRIEDIDLMRCREEYAGAIVEDLNWLGFKFSGNILLQSTRFSRYEKFIKILKDMGVLYPCFCTRKNIREELDNISSAPHQMVVDQYPGKCRGLSRVEREDKLSRGLPCSWRLDCKKAGKITGCLEWTDLRHGVHTCCPQELGDMILARKDCPVSYHVAVVVDDFEQGITHVTRGEDLLNSTHVHRLLQALWGFDVPVWYHHELVRDCSGKRLAKRSKSTSIRALKESGLSAEEILSMV